MTRRASQSPGMRPLSPMVSTALPTESWRLLSRQFPWLSAEPPLKTKIMALLAARPGESNKTTNLLGAVFGRLGNWLAKAHDATFGRLFWLAVLASLKNGVEQFNQARTDTQQPAQDAESSIADGR